MQVGIVKFPEEDLAGFDLAEGDLLLDVIEDHQEVFAFLGVSRIVVGHCDDGTVVLHDDSGEFEGDLEFLA